MDGREVKEEGAGYDTIGLSQVRDDTDVHHGSRGGSREKWVPF